MSAATFQALPLSADENGFRPLAAMSQDQAGFLVRLPQDMVRFPKTEPRESSLELRNSVPEPDDRSPPAAPVPATAEPPVVDGIAEKAYAEGFARGRAEVEAELGELRAGLDEAAGVLNGVLNQIQVAVESETETLAQVLDELVRSLAAERAGAQIDADPASFGLRIIGMAERISESFSGLVVRLNPLDLDALYALRRRGKLPQLEGLFQASLASDPDLARGDVRLRAQGLALDDLLSVCQAP